MDFFEAQARAKQRTSRLVVLFGLGVIGTVLAAYAAALIGASYVEGSQSRRHHRDYDDTYADTSPAFTVVRPGLFLAVAAGTLAVVGLASLVKWTEFSSGGSAVAESVGGRRVDPHTTDLHERRLLNVVEEMAIASGTPVPAVYVLDDEPAINAFAAGLTTSDAVVAVTRGTLQKLNRDELQGVVGHEFSHILNGDMRLNLRLSALLFGILVLGLAGRGILWNLRFARVSNRGGKNGGGIVVAILFAGLALMIIGYVGYFFGRLIQAAVSRQREFLADASAVQFTRNPAGIGGALRKIGGYALGSSLQTNKAAAIGHFFFAQSFRSSFAGLWATHPPLDQRLRALDPQWDGQFFEPPEVVDVTRKSFVSAGLAPAKTASPFAALSPTPLHSPPSSLNSQPPPSGSNPPIPPHYTPSAATASVAAAGTLTPAQLANAASLLEHLPSTLREAAHSPATVSAVVLGVLLDDEPALRARQLAALPTDVAARLVELDPDLRTLTPAQKFPLLQLTLPALRQLSPATLDPVFSQLDQLVHTDDRVTPFEFALQKTLLRHLALARDPKRAVVQFYSFAPLVDDIATVLSTLAHASVADPAYASAAFAVGAAQIKLIESQLSLQSPATDLAALDRALDRLAAASLPIRQRVLIAAAHVVGADGRILLIEAELLRAISAALDVPLPPLAPSR